ncbi:hypothetical protein PHJA_002654100 [Phtheirospermum japonicum]|uniref:Uncharacterized protein n=1 Tax=Phtheirospermum japonicum TaxID=374723 RepID=A0A830D1E8_9LAMI|nr:hypothetical protein PHJA_002080300 [Phtheirospermum japonicum]GFQ05100.1 hypothetical protein PHJA_002654100 [Phtheirospermum japonicum]
MDCYEPVDDYCDAWQSDNLEIPQNTPNLNFNFDQFFIALELEITCPLMEDDCEEDEQKETFWAPCPRIERENLPKDKISSMLSSAGVPMHKQRFMVDRISSRADEIANAAHNENKRILPMVISISIVACSCYGETVFDPDHPMDGVSDGNY